MKVRILLTALFALSVAVLFNAGSAHALSGSSFQAGNIISDGNFFDADSMTATDIQNFLNAKVPSCDTNGLKKYTGGKYAPDYNHDGVIQRWERGKYAGNPAPFTCLRNYKQNTPAMAGESTICGEIPAKTGRSATGIIADISAACGISPKVLIVLLQKEQGLVTDDWPWKAQYQKATGFSCTDSAPCDPAYSGFFYQVYYAARQYNLYRANPTNYNFIAGQNNFILYSPDCSTRKTVYIQNQATAGLYDYTPYTPNAAALNNLYGTGDACSSYGNRNFWRYYSDWFGNPAAPPPYPFKTAGSSAVYVYADGYKFAVPSMALLQDYGFSPGSIRTLSVAAANSIPTPDPSSGLDTTLSYVIKTPSDTDADSSTVYLTTLGKRFRVTSMSQLADFGFSGADIAHLPLNFIYSLGGDTDLSNYIQAPTKLVFQVADGAKRPILNFATFQSLNPSGTVTKTSYAVVNLLTAGNPLTNSAAVIKTSESPAIYIYTPSGQSYSFPSFAAYMCWGAGSLAGLTLQSLPSDYMAVPSPTGSLSCLVQDTGSNKFVLNRTSKYSIPGAYGSFTTQALNADLTAALSNIPTNGKTLERTVKSSASPAVWYLENGKKRSVPSMSNYRLLGLSAGKTTILESGAIDAMAVGLPKLGTGQVVKVAGSSAVYVVAGDQRYGIASANDFNAFYYRWGDIETYDLSTLNSAYPTSGTNISNYLYRSANNTVYLLDAAGCYSLSSALLTSYGKTQSQIQADQAYPASALPYVPFGDCTTGSQYVKSSSSATVYMLDGGQKRRVASWEALTTQAGTDHPRIIRLSQPFIDSFPNGPVLN